MNTRFNEIYKITSPKVADRVYRRVGFIRHGRTEDGLRWGDPKSVKFLRTYKVPRALPGVRICKTNPISNSTHICPTRSTIHGSRFMQNEPNLHTRNTQYYIRNTRKRTQFYDQGTDQTSKRCKFYPKLWNLSAKGGNIYPQNAKFSKKIHKNTRLLHFSINDTLNSIYNKDLHKYFTCISRRSAHGGAVLPQNTLNERTLPAIRVAGKYEKQTQSSTTERRALRDERRIVQNEPNLTNAVYKVKSPPKAAQINNQSSMEWPNFSSTHLPRNLSAKGGPIHFFMQNEPNYKTSRIVHRKHAKRTQCKDAIREYAKRTQLRIILSFTQLPIQPFTHLTQICKTNPI